MDTAAKRMTETNEIINTMEREAVLNGDLPFEGVRVDEVLPGALAGPGDGTLGLQDIGWQDEGDFEAL